MLRCLTAVVGLTLLAPEVVYAQAVRYQPSATEHQGREIVAVLIGSSECGFSTNTKFMEMIDPMLRSLQAQARSRGLGFTAIGVAIDGPPENGVAYLRKVANFDEVLAGRYWLNTGLSHYWAIDSLPPPATPAFFVLERDFSDGVNSPRSVRTRHLFFVKGMNGILAFGKRGAPVIEFLAKQPPAN